MFNLYYLGETISMWKRFVVYGLLGWCMEVFWTGLGSLISGDVRLVGETCIWMFPIYGLAIFLEPIHDFIRSYPAIIRGGIYTVLIYLAEYSTGFLLKVIIGVCPWRYTDSLSVNGLITLYFIPVWFTVGLLFEKIHDLLLRVKILS